MLHNLSRSQASRDPIVKLRRRFCYPACDRIPQFHASNCRVMPEKSVPPTRKEKRNGDFCIALDQIDHTSFLVQTPVLMLPQTIKPLVLVGTKTRIKMDKITLPRLKGTGP